MSAVLSEAETKFFSSRGEDVDASLRPVDSSTEPGDAAPTTTPAPPPVAPSVVAAPPAATPEPAAPPVQQVPLAALHEERQKRAKAEQERQQLQQALEQLQKAQQQPPAQAPDYSQDPLGALAFYTEQHQRELDDFKKWRTEQQQATQQQTARNQFAQSLTTAENAFRAKQPDYDAAASYALQQYDKLLMALIPNPEQRRQQVLVEAMSAAARVMGEGRDPAEFVYSFAKNMGYTAAPPPGAAPVAPPPPAAVAPVPDVVKTIEKGLKQQSNLGSGGSTPPSEVTAEMALAMNGEDFNKWWAKQFRR